MAKEAALQRILEAPSVLGLALCTEKGDVVIREGAEIDSVTQVLGCFLRATRALRGSVAANDFHQATVQGKTLTVLCMPHEGGAIGVALDARAHVPEVALMMRRAMDRN